MSWIRKTDKSKHPSEVSKPARGASRLGRMTTDDLHNWAVRLLNDAGRALGEGEDPLFYDSARLLAQVADEMENRDVN